MTLEDELMDGEREKKRKPKKKKVKDNNNNISTSDISNYASSYSPSGSEDSAIKRIASSIGGTLLGYGKYIIGTGTTVAQGYAFYKYAHPTFLEKAHEIRNSYPVDTNFNGLVLLYGLEGAIIGASLGLLGLVNGFIYSKNLRNNMFEDLSDNMQMKINLLSAPTLSTAGGLVGSFFGPEGMVTGAYVGSAIGLLPILFKSTF